ncbi:hypothetical protein ENBRE01_2785 [Enteropsectra breve]|nr:hypothetical protein ENBRE01_2785 [Enteropsectra breve]
MLPNLFIVSVYAADVLISPADKTAEDDSEERRYLATKNPDGKQGLHFSRDHESMHSIWRIDNNTDNRSRITQEDSRLTKDDKDVLVLLESEDLKAENKRMKTEAIAEIINQGEEEERKEEQIKQDALQEESDADKLILAEMKKNEANAPVANSGTLPPSANQPNAVLAIPDATAINGNPLETQDATNHNTAVQDATIQEATGQNTAVQDVTIQDAATQDGNANAGDDNQDDNHDENDNQYDKQNDNDNNDNNENKDEKDKTDDSKGDTDDKDKSDKKDDSKDEKNKSGDGKPKESPEDEAEDDDFFTYKGLTEQEKEINREQEEHEKEDKEGNDKEEDKEDGEKESKLKSGLLGAKINNSQLAADNKSENENTKSTEGYDFTLFPISLDEQTNYVLIIFKNLCLTHSLKFEACTFANYWDLEKRFYWIVARSTDGGVFGILRKYVTKRDETNLKSDKNKSKAKNKKRKVRHSKAKNKYGVANNKSYNMSYNNMSYNNRNINNNRNMNNSRSINNYMSYNNVGNRGIQCQRDRRCPLLTNGMNGSRNAPCMRKSPDCRNMFKDGVRVKSDTIKVNESLRNGLINAMPK